MDNPDLFRPKRIQYAGKLSDLHPDQNGSCKSHMFSDEKGIQYVGKTNFDNHHFLVPNEYLSTKLLNLLGIPSPKVLLHTKNGDQFFLSQYGVNAKKLISFTPREITSSVSNVGDLIGILCFDVWVMNYDRHLNNVIIQNGLVYAIDHDRAIFNLSTDESRLLLRNTLDPIKFLRKEYCEYLSETVTSFTQVQVYIDRIKNISNDQIREIIFNDADLILEQKYKDILLKVLVERRNNIEELMKRIFRHSALFPKITIVIS